MQFPLSTASRIASELKVPLVVDVRDVIEQYVHYEFAKHKIYPLPWLNDRLHDIRKLFIVKRRNAILKKADAITTISTWHKIYYRHLMIMLRLSIMVMILNCFIRKNLLQNAL